MAFCQLGLPLLSDSVWGFFRQCCLDCFVLWERAAPALLESVRLNIVRSTMKRLVELLLTTTLFLLGIPAISQSVADVARSTRDEKKPAATKVYTNDDLPSVPESNMAEQSPADGTSSNGEAAASNAEAGDAASTTSEKSGSKNAPSDSKDWKSEVSQQEDKVKQLEKEIDLMQRENKLRQAAFYGDAGSQLRDQKKWADEQRAYQTDLEAKQKELDEAKQKLDDTREDARKSGVPSRQLE